MRVVRAGKVPCTSNNRKGAHLMLQRQLAHLLQLKLRAACRLEAHADLLEKNDICTNPLYPADDSMVTMLSTTASVVLSRLQLASSH